MEILLVILTSVAFISSTISIALSCYIKSTLEAQLTSKIAEDLYAAKEELIGVEHRLEGLMDKKLNSSAAQMREIAQNDAVDLVEATINNQGNLPSEGLGIGSFKNLGR
jgi:hypothetical protein